MSIEPIYATYTAVILLSFLSIFSTFIGVTLAIYIGKNERAIALGIGFSAGIMLLISFLELMPEAVDEAGLSAALGSFVSGLLIIAALNWIIPHTHLAEENGPFGVIPMRSVYLVVFGLILHDVPEGFGMANSYIASPSLGLLVALAIAIHNIPEEFAMAIPIVMAKKKRFLYKAAFLSALAEPLGAIIGLTATHFFHALSPLFMAFAAGAMVFISIHELLPMAKKYHKINLFILGVILSVFVYLLLSTLILE